MSTDEKRSDGPARGRGRRRSGTRKEMILQAAANLVAARGYHAVAMADIGDASGITGPGIYRHFQSKSAVLVALFDRVVDELLDRVAMTMTRGRRTPAEAQRILDELIRDQVLFALEQRAILKVYLQEIHYLPEEDRQRLLAKQRRYVGQWIVATRASRPDLSAGEARSLVHAAIGAIQSVLHYDSDLPAEQIRDLMTAVARSVLLQVVPAQSCSLATSAPGASPEGSVKDTGTAARRRGGPRATS